MEPLPEGNDSRETAILYNEPFRRIANARVNFVFSRPQAVG
jgi:hypothetical protein